MLLWIWIYNRSSWLQCLLPYWNTHIFHSYIMEARPVSIVQSVHLNPFTTKISCYLVILIAINHTILWSLVKRIQYWINWLSPYLIFFSSCLKAILEGEEEIGRWLDFGEVPWQKVIHRCQIIMYYWKLYWEI